MLLFGLMFAIGAVPGLGDVKAGDGGVAVTLNGLGAVVFAAVALGYHFAWEATNAKSLGKALLGLRVVGEDGAPAAPKAVAIRTLLRLVDVLPVLYLVGFITMLSARPRGRRVGDLVAKTGVVRS